MRSSWRNIVVNYNHLIVAWRIALPEIGKLCFGRSLALVTVLAVSACSSIENQSQAYLTGSQVKSSVNRSGLDAQGDNHNTVMNRPKPVTMSAKTDSLSATTQANNPGAATVGYATHTRHAKPRFGDYGGSEFVKENSSLFSAKIDLEPYPTPSTAAWKRMKERDEQQETQAKKAITICKGC